MKKSDNNLFILDSSLNLKMFSYIQDKIELMSSGLYQLLEEQM